MADNKDVIAEIVGIESGSVLAEVVAGRADIHGADTADP
ncbi:hypothetical protein GGQ99_005193 [Aminobacter niigataensis]|uniref:Uncharacterized protein n=1 Tax=Aminobacter niigataensis TaxID=83265 RepID=A0ABR6L9B9_9HYPH|nr:hypothetical protein [Aminobacter niigataensis]